MADYLNAWNSILTDRQSSLFVLTATLSNLGRFDSFVRAKGKVVVGTYGAKAPIEFIVEQYGEDATQLGRSQYISEESRRTKTVRFLARLEKEKRQSVRAAYESGLVYVRLALPRVCGRWGTGWNRGAISGRCRGLGGGGAYRWKRSWRDQPTARIGLGLKISSFFRIRASSGLIRLA